LTTRIFRRRFLDDFGGAVNPLEVSRPHVQAFPCVCTVCWSGFAKFFKNTFSKHYIVGSDESDDGDDPRGKCPTDETAAILEAAMTDDVKKPTRELKELADELLDSISEAPEMEPGDADTTPAVPDTPNTPPIGQKPKS
jgi:hypothetical protein